MKYLSLFCFIFLFSCAKTVYVADVDVSYLRIDDKQSEQSMALDSLIEPYRAKLDTIMNEQIAYAKGDLVKEKPGGSLGNWFADIFYDASVKSFGEESIDIAFQNYGGIRIPVLGKGPITVGDIYELMPFDNEVVTMEMDSASLQILLDKIADYGGWPISGATFAIQDTVAVDVFIGGEAFTNQRTYTIVLPDYIANGGGGCFFLEDMPRSEKDVLIRDLIIGYLKKSPIRVKEVTPSNEMRIKSLSYE